MKKKFYPPGTRFGNLTYYHDMDPLVSRKDEKIRYRRIGKFRCSCGVIFTARMDHVKDGRVTSCGCSRKKKSTYKTHGLRHHPLYARWRDIKKRCYNKNTENYKYYGGRGIKVCDAWMDFKVFYDYVLSMEGEGVLDIIDFDKDYAPGNIEWGNLHEQNKKKMLLRMKINRGILA